MGTGEFPAQMASNAENASIWWRHHVRVHFAEHEHDKQLPFDNSKHVHCMRLMCVVDILWLQLRTVIIPSKK